ncbi:hypothetical protein OC834_004960 [Tilletia horrida]|uniref:Uncharacterized protein n=1 Tax=Tilletia horrida TaxID=155126 RepID=A0AAN6GD97_9BASI|nr:hypothetical protein OC834_004960 [Tilletia horrida]KAK0534391.1 hypothetical protein OC842_002654 [Tilletia horrida]KAK0539848.1 hypothetical protein OC835_000943 [Tilletia horrida]KAK0558593.1 hypothetical protein OC844_005035 [Tilletia horrida]
MRYALAAATILGLASAAVANDDRVLVQYKSFCDRWNSACQAYTPQDPSLVFAYTLCEPGDYKGQNATSEAKVYCSFTHKGQPNGPFTLVTKHIETQVGATQVNTA